jgi:hypothetical protein
MSAAETSALNFFSASMRKSVCSFVRRLRGVFEDVRLMQQAIEQPVDNGHVAQQIASVSDGPVGRWASRLLSALL